MTEQNRWTPKRCAECNSEALLVYNHEYALCTDCHRGFSFAEASAVAGLDERPDIIHCPHPDRASAFNFVRPGIGIRSTEYECPTCEGIAASIAYEGPDRDAGTRRKPYCYWCCDVVETQPYVPGPRRVVDTKVREDTKQLEKAGQLAMFGGA